MLLSAGLPLPLKTYTHSFYMIDGQKMSKSLGNVISPQELIDEFGVDGSRYLIARSFPGENDSDVGIVRFKEKYNADLANNLGNLVSRVTKLASGLQIETSNPSKSLPSEDLRTFDKGDFGKLIDELKLDEAIGWVFEKFIDKSNSRLNEVAPWKLPANDPKKIEVLTECVQNLQQAAYYLKPVMPETCEQVEKVLNGKIKALEKPLFPRIV